MDLLKKLMGEGVPEWAQPMSPKEFREFRRQVEADLKGRNASPAFDWEQGCASVQNLKMNFSNLLVRWREAEPTKRSGLVAEFCGGMIESLQSKKAEFLDQLDNLLIRVYDFEYPNMDVCVTQPIGRYLLPTLVIDSPTSTVTVNPKHIEESGMSVDELFELAKKNLALKVKPQQTNRISPIGEFITIEAEYFGASFITLLESLAQPGETYWVATPNKHILLILKPTEENEESLLTFLNIANKFSNQIQNDYILPFVLEYNGGKFRDLCVRIDGGIEILDGLFPS
jgi:hypothetical protein